MSLTVELAARCHRDVPDPDPGPEEKCDYISALTFYDAPHLVDFYSGDRPMTEIVHGPARACGHW